MLNRLSKVDMSEREAVIDYIATLATELANIARKHGFETLGYILDMARLEAEKQLPTQRKH